MSNPAFQHRHYKAIADVINELRDAPSANSVFTELLISRFGDMFQRDNDRFVRSRFEGACIGDYSTRKDKVR